MMNKSKTPTQADKITDKELALLPAGVRLLVDETDPQIQRYVAIARKIAKIKANRHERS